MPKTQPEPNQRLRRHKLLTAEDRRKLPVLGSTDGAGMDAIAHVKFFSPYGRYTFYVTEISEDGLELYGYTVSPLGPDCDEWGYGSFREIAEATTKLLGRIEVPAIERDCFWTPVSVGEALNGR